MNRSLTLTLWALHRLESEELPKIATDWLAEGHDSRSLRELAGIASPEMSEVGPLFEKALLELMISIPKKEEALMFLARHYAQQIVDGVVTPYEGARKIWWQVSNSFDAHNPLLIPFVGAASELEDLPERTAEDGYDRKKYAAELEDSILSSARRLLEEAPIQLPEPTSGLAPGRGSS